MNEATKQSLIMATVSSVKAALMDFAGVGSPHSDADIPTTARLRSAEFGYHLYPHDYNAGPMVRVSVTNVANNPSNQQGMGAEGRRVPQTYLLRVQGVSRPVASDPETAASEATLLTQIIESRLPVYPFTNLPLVSTATTSGKRAIVDSIYWLSTEYDESDSDNGSGTGGLANRVLFTMLFQLSVSTISGTFVA